MQKTQAVDLTRWVNLKETLARFETMQEDVYQKRIEVSCIVAIFIISLSTFIPFIIRWLKKLWEQQWILIFKKKLRIFVPRKGYLLKVFSIFYVDTFFFFKKKNSYSATMIDYIKLLELTFFTFQYYLQEDPQMNHHLQVP